MNNMNIDDLLKELNRIDAGGGWTKCNSSNFAITSKIYTTYFIYNSFQTIAFGEKCSIWVGIKHKNIELFKNIYGINADIDETIQALTGAKIILQAMENLNEN